MNKFLLLLIILILSTSVYADLAPSPKFHDSSLLIFIKALIITIVLESLVSLIYLSKIKNKEKIIISIILANIISFPLIWFISPLFNLLTLSELFAVFFEAFFIFLLNKEIISLRKSLILSLIMNITSFFFGEILLIFFY